MQSNIAQQEEVRGMVVLDHIADSGKKVERTAETAQNTSSCAHENDVISRKAAIDAVEKSMYENPHENEIHRGMHDHEHRHFLTILMGLPAVQPDIIRCKDCKYWREHKYAKETKRYIPFCGFNAIYTKADDYCSKAERRTE